MKRRKLAAAALSLTVAAGSMGMPAQPRIVSSAPLTASAAYEKFDYENLKCQDDGGVISIIGYTEAPSGELAIPSEINGEKVTEIRDFVFMGCEGITSVVLPDTIETIGGSAFKDCVKLTSVALPDDLEELGYSAFEGCTGLTEVTIPKNINTGNYNNWYYAMFKGCTGLKKVTFADGRETVPDEIFSGCTSLETVILPDTINKIGARSFTGCTSLKSIKLPDGIQQITESAFEGCTALNTVSFPKSLLSIGSKAFMGCALPSVEFPEGLIQIDSKAFADCKGLKTVKLPESLTSVRADAFDGTPFGEKPTVIVRDNTLVSVIGAKGEFTIPDGITKIGGSAFANNTELTAVNIPDSVTVIGMSAFSGCSGLTSIDLPESINKISISAFSGTGLTSVKIPKNVTTVEYGVFSGCESLKTVELHDGIKEIHGAQMYPGAFSGCTALESIDIPSSVNVIGPSVFSGCTSLKEITVPEGVTELSFYVFNGCTSLEKVALPDSLEWVDKVAFGETPYLASLKADSNGMIIVGKTLLDGSACKDDITIPENVTCIAGSAFEGNTDITSVRFAAPMKKIGIFAFRKCTGLTSAELPVAEQYDYYTSNIYNGCTGLKSVTIAEGVKDIPDGVFKECAALTDVIIPEGVETISSSAFLGCTSLGSVKLPDSISEVKSSAFEDCTSLEKVTMPADFTNFGENSFTNTPWFDSQCKDEDFKIVNGVVLDAKQKSGDIVIPDGVKAIRSAFSGCDGITSVKLPEGLETIGYEAFYGCKGLTSIELPSTVKTLGYRAFAGCTGLTSIKLPESVERIDMNAFDGCSNLSKVEFAESIKDIDGRAFNNTAWLAAKRAEDPIVIVNGVVIDGKSATGDVVIDEGPDTIGEYAFFGSQAKTVVVPKSVNRILACAFTYCPNLEKITISNEDCYVYPGAATISNTYSVLSYYEGDIQLGDGSGQTTTTSDGGGTGQSTTTTASTTDDGGSGSTTTASTTDDGGNGSTTAASTTDDGGNGSTTAASTTDDGGNGSTTAASTTDDGGNGSTTAASTTDDGGNGSTTAASTTDDGGNGSTTTADKTVVKYYGYGTVANGFYFNHDTNKFNSGHADGIDKLVSVNASGEKEEVTIEKTNYTFAAASNNADNPQDTYSREQKDFTYPVNVFYDGVQVFNEDDTPMQFKAFIGVKGDGNFDNVVDSSDASAVLVYYAKMSTGADPTETRFAPSSCKAVNDNPELDELAAMLVDIDQDVLSDGNWKKQRSQRVIDANDASRVLRFYSAASTTAPEDFSAKATWDTILGR
ncbi:MAG: leucine-rich repeat protein [Ruminococcus sp.]|nr:leucine-rich repeat protein [Ruminococcus sp.]